MDPYGRRKLFAAIILTALIIMGLIVEAMQDKTLRNHSIGYLGIMLAGLFGLIGLAFAWFAP